MLFRSHFFDSDDIAAPNKHEVQLKALLESGADIAYGPWVKGRFGNLTTEHTEGTEDRFIQKQGYAWASQAGAAFSNPSTSELARDSKNTPLTHSAIGPATEPECLASKLEDAFASQSTTRAVDGPANECSSFRFPVSGFSPSGPVLQARGLPEGDLVRALLTNWSVVPHACLFRRSILEKAGGFPEDIWVGEDQLLFLRCLLAGAKVVHSPGTMVFYRLGEEGKLTESKEGQRRRVVDWGRFLVKAKEEVASGGKGNHETHEMTRNEEAGPCLDKPSSAAFSTPSTSELARDSENTSLNRSAIGPASELRAEEDRRSKIEERVLGSVGGNQLADSEEFLGGQSQAGLHMGSQKLQNICEANAPSTSGINSSSVSISVIRGKNSSESKQVPCSATDGEPPGAGSGTGQRPCLQSETSALEPLATLDPSAWFGFRLRAYEAWRDLRAFFPGEYLGLESGLEGIWKKSKFSVFSFQFSVFLRQKLGGLKQRIIGHRWPGSFRCGVARRLEKMQ